MDVRSNAVVPYSTPDHPPSPIVFPFGRLPYELRAQVVLAAATRLYTRDCPRLLRVSREFHEVVAPCHWSVSRLSVGLGGSIETILTLYTFIGHLSWVRTSRPRHRSAQILRREGSASISVVGQDHEAGLDQ